MLQHVSIHYQQLAWTGRFSFSTWRRWSLLPFDILVVGKGGIFLPVVQHIDNLPREKAFFKGPAPLLLSSLSPDDLTFLLLGSDPKTSQVHSAFKCSGQLFEVSICLTVPSLQTPCRGDACCVAPTVHC